MMKLKRTAWIVAAAIGTAGLAAAAALQIAPNLVGHWGLDEAGGPTAVDSQAGNNGTWNGAPTAVGTVPAPIATFSTNALQVTRPGQNYVEIPNAPALENLQEADYTISAWFYPNSTPPVNAPPDDNESVYGIVYKTGWHEGMGYNENGDFSMEHWVYDSAAGTPNIWAGVGTWSAGPYGPGQWYHVAGVVDFAARTTSIYVNGTLVDTNAWAATTATMTDYREYNQTPWRIGIANPAGGYNNWEYQADGIIDDVRFYNRVLTAGEIANLASGTDMGAIVPPAPAPPPGPPSNREGEDGDCSWAVVEPPSPRLWGWALLAALPFLLRRR